MHITGIIAEYNPLHLGHQYHIEQTRLLIKEARFDSDTDISDEAHYIVTVLSGDFVQRGLPAIVDKHARTRMALETGSDLVLELPVPYALSSGEGFGFGGVSLLHQLGCVDALSFGTEEGTLDKLTDIAKVLTFENRVDFASLPSVENTPYHQAYQTAVKQGFTHPEARLQALSAAYPDLDLSVLDGQSNNMLALEYCKALLQLNSDIQPITVKRTGQGYHDSTFDKHTFASATAIREALKHANACDTAVCDTAASTADWIHSVPSFVQEQLAKAQTARRLLHPDDFSLLLHYKLLTLTKEALCEYQEVTQDFANKIMKNLGQFQSFTQFANLLWTKDMTYARVCRNLMNIILEIKENTWDVHQPVPYARVLGFRKDSAPLLSEIKKHASIPMISKLADAEKVLSLEAYRLLELDMKAAHVYDSIVQHKSQKPALHEMQKQIVIV